MRQIPTKPIIRRTKSISNGTLAVSAVGLAIFVFLAGTFWLKYQIYHTDFTVDTKLKQIILSNDVLNIPANLIRFERQRNSDTLDRIDLAILWPDGSGYSQKLSTDFQNTGLTTNVIFLSLVKRKLSLDMSGRLGSVYSKLFAGEKTAGPAGLYFQPLKQGSGYDGEQLAIYKDENLTWVARCQDSSAPTRPTCMRDIFLGESLSLQYRFPRHLLKHWLKIENLVLKKIGEMLTR